uniref:Uncharacterized protein n=1 Tax=Timema monikensis TaxID=170555 RepID=A0A7R9DZU5_9NEOP|nr:unnamed protein product [Timema monikensis]
MLDYVIHYGTVVCDHLSFSLPLKKKVLGCGELEGKGVNEGNGETTNKGPVGIKSPILVTRGNLFGTISHFGIMPARGQNVMVLFGDEISPGVTAFDESVATDYMY